MEPNQERYNSQDQNDPFFSDKIIINEETEILMEESEDELIETVEPLKLLYGICMKCGQRRSYYRWCILCERKQSEENFKNWTSGNNDIDEFIKHSQFHSSGPQTFLEWIPFNRLENTKYLSKASRSTVYSAIWKDGPRVLWNHQNQEYKRSKAQVLVKLYHEDQVNEILNELKIYLDCYARDCALLIQFYGISQHPGHKAYLLIKQYAQNDSLHNYILHNFKSLDWEIKLHLLLYLAEDLKALHNSDYVHRNLNPPNVFVFENGLCAIGSYSKCRKDLSSPNAEEIFGWQRYMAPEFLRYKPYTKASDIYSFGMIMYTVGTGMIPYNQSHDDQYLTLDVCLGLRPKIPVNIPESFSELVIRCWKDEPESRPNIHEIHNSLMNWWSSIYNKCLNSTCLEFFAANDRDHINLKSQKIVQQKSENDKPLILPDLKNLEPLELIKFIISNHFVKYINRDELSTTMEHIGSGHFGTISKTIWKKTNDRVVCKRLKNIESINNKLVEAFLHELSMHRRLDFCSRIIRILGISFDETTEEYLFVMQYADGGDLRNYLQQNFSRLKWEDKIRLAHQITEGINYLHEENILHRDLHSKNIVIHQGEAKIIDLGIAKSTETETNLHPGVFGMISYIDPKLLENCSYKYDKKSDIYSLGVLMWELSSGCPPFNNNEDLILLRINLICGAREVPIPDTPIEYLNLYKSCWDNIPDLRPSIKQVFNKLGKMFNFPNNTIHDDNNDPLILQDSINKSEIEQSSSNTDIDYYEDSTIQELVF
ncbi:kinase-like domain-containing protein [Rhizophagus diaphanus]|nr:kinase-like domain-containing protein [Rhizophagus diaphanus] [Rhizophagus sp. MUCL 43196]